MKKKREIKQQQVKAGRGGAAGCLKEKSIIINRALKRKEKKVQK